MEYVLVLQWEASETFDRDALVAIEDSIIATVKGDALVDGHDVGSGRANIFVVTDSPCELFERLRISALKDEMRRMSVAYRAKRGEAYTVLWPPGQKEFMVK